MYQSYWQLNERPFENNRESRFYYPSQPHQGALLKLRYAVENRQQVVLLSGNYGLGKTILVERLLTHLPEEHFATDSRIVYPMFEADQLAAAVADSLTGTVATGETNVRESLSRIEAALAERRRQGRHAIVWIDEAQLLSSPKTLETLRLLTNLPAHAAPNMTLLLSGIPGLLPVLGRCPGLEQRIEVKCMLRPLSVEETVSYVDHRLRQAGSTKTIFEPEALEQLYLLAEGIPRRINRLADLALLIGYAEERDSIGPAQIESVNEELVCVAPE